MAPLVRARRPSSATVAKAASPGSASTISATRRSAGGRTVGVGGDAGRQVGHATDGTVRAPGSQQTLHVCDHGGAVRCPRSARPTRLVRPRSSSSCRRTPRPTSTSPCSAPPTRSGRWAARPVPERAEAIAAVGAVLTAPQGRAGRAGAAARPGRSASRAAARCRRPSTWPPSWPGRAGPRWGEVVPSELHDKLAWTTRIPVGVVGMITPWNFPMAIPSWKIFPALLAGNGVVMKPSELAPACGVAFVDACIEAGIPADLLQVVHGGPEPAAALATHPGVGAVSFTGSVPTGRKVAAAAMEVGPKLVSLELGRQERHGRARRRRPRPRARRCPLRGLRHVRPALHLDVPSDPAARHRRLRRRPPRRAGAGAGLGRPARSHRPTSGR